MNKTRRFIASLLVVSITGLGLPLPSQAAIVGTDAALAAAQRDRVATMLDRGDVRAQLEAHGVRPADVKARVAALTDEEGWMTFIQNTMAKGFWVRVSVLVTMFWAA